MMLNYKGQLCAFETILEKLERLRNAIEIPPHLVRDVESACRWVEVAREEFEKAESAFEKAESAIDEAQKELDSLKALLAKKEMA